MRRRHILALVRRERVSQALRYRARRLFGRAIESTARRLGYDAVPAGYHSVVTRVADVEPSVWSRRSPLHGISLDSADQMAWAERELEPFLREFAAEPPP